MPLGARVPNRRSGGPNRMAHRRLAAAVTTRIAAENRPPPPRRRAPRRRRLGARPRPRKAARLWPPSARDRPRRRPLPAPDARRRSPSSPPPDPGAARAAGRRSPSPGAGRRPTETASPPGSATIACAFASPIPGRVASSSTVARFRSDLLLRAERSPPSPPPRPASRPRRDHAPTAAPRRPATTARAFRLPARPAGCIADALQPPRARLRFQSIGPPCVARRAALPCGGARRRSPARPGVGRATRCAIAITRAPDVKQSSCHGIHNVATRRGGSRCRRHAAEEEEIRFAAETRACAPSWRLPTVRRAPASCSCPDVRGIAPLYRGSRPKARAEHGFARFARHLQPRGRPGPAGHGRGVSLHRGASRPPRARRRRRGRPPPRRAAGHPRPPDRHRRLLPRRTVRADGGVS